MALQPSLPTSCFMEAAAGGRDFATRKVPGLQELWMLARGSDGHQMLSVGRADSPSQGSAASLKAMPHEAGAGDLYTGNQQ
jgi:hypothetical protein